MHDPALQLAIFGRMALAAALGFSVGFEREARGKAAGERTIALVAAGAAAFASLAADALPADRRPGPRRGRHRRRVPRHRRDLAGARWGPPAVSRTAAATWTVAATGVLAGVGFYLTAILATAVTMLILELEFMPLIGPLLHRMAPGSPDRADGPSGPEPE